MMKEPWKVLIISCWSLLLICMVVKLFGFNIFEPATENQNFIKACEFIDSNIVIKYIVYALNALLINSLFILSVMKQKFYSKVQLFIFVPLIIISSIISWYSSLIKTILDVIFVVVLPLIYKTNWKRIVIGFVLLLAFQIISLITKNIGNWYLNNEPALVALILQIDTVIMTTLYYLYSNYSRKEIHTWEH